MNGVATDHIDRVLMALSPTTNREVYMYIEQVFLKDLLRILHAAH